MPTRPFPVPIEIRFEGADPDAQAPELVAHAFDARGRHLASTPLKKGTGKLQLPGEADGAEVRFLLAPPGDDRETPSYAKLMRAGALQRRIRITEKEARLDITLLEPDWSRLLLCRCVVRGRVVKRVPLPDGSVQELPICHTRVTICEVDRLPRLIYRLPDDLIRRLRDELVHVIREPIPLPDPRPGPFPDPFPPPRPGPGPDPAPFERVAVRGLAEPQPQSSRALLSASHETALETRSIALDDLALRPLLRATQIPDIRAQLVANVELLRPFLCLWPWLDPYFTWRVDCLETVHVDADGRFETVIRYPCGGDRPDLWFRAEQLHGSSWETIYARPVRCSTHWNYACGTEITLVVTDPSAVPCVPEDPVDPPPGIGTWIMPLAVGGAKIWGTPPGAPAAPFGWVRSDGLIDYGGGQDSPFGSTLALRHGHSYDIPNGVTHYRWSFRRTGTADAWKPLTREVIRRYVKQSPGALPTFPAYVLGPKTVGGQADLFEFKPHSPPGPDAGDPAGTITYWPVDNWFGDIWSGFFETLALEGGVAAAAGSWDMRLEAFDATGTRVAPGAGTFRFIVPTGTGPDGVTILARAAQPTEIVDDAFVFRIHVDNNACDAVLEAPTIGATATADACGFLRYDPASGAPVTLSFTASHPNGHARLGVSLVRGTTAVGAANASGDVDDATVGAYTNDGSMHFSNSFAIGTLLGTCANAAFAWHLHVHAKAMNGFSSIDAYDAGAVRAFALTEND